MEGDKQFGKGRGSILLKLLKEKEKAENEGILQGISSTLNASNNAKESKNQTEFNIQSVIEIPSSSTIGRGRASLLQVLKEMKSSEILQPKPIQTISSGRGSLLSRLKTTSLNETIPQQPNIVKNSSDDAGVLGKLSDITIQENKPKSEASHKPMSHQGTEGEPIQLGANYINLKLDPAKGLFNYEVKFNPDIDSRPLRRKLLNQHVQALGRTKVFDGVTLYLPQKLKQDINLFTSIHPMDESKVELKVIYKKQQSISENIPFFNVLLGRVMRALSLVRIGQHSFNPKGIHSVPQHKLEVWPGYVTAINEYDGGLKLCIDARHRVMRTETVRDIMMKFGGKPNFKDIIIRELIGLSVFTRYNNKTYRIDDIAWDKNPTYEFDKGTDKISLINYYKLHWNLEITDKGQPLLVHCAKNKLSTGETQEQLILLVPELCYLASLSDSIRSDFRVMKDLDSLTKMSPNARCDVFRHFVEQVRSNSVPREILSEWGLELESDIAEFTGRVFGPEQIQFANAKFIPPPAKPAEWSSAVCRNTVLRTPNLNHWCVLYCQKDTRCTQEFVGMLKNVAKVIGMNVREPQMICLRDDRIETYVQALKKNIDQTVNLMVIVFPTNRTDRYSAVKRVCCVEMPVPSQVIMSRTISRGDKLKSITEKIALQINCKLGGALWALAIPMDHCMICGIDVYHSGVGQSMKGSVAGFVASLDKLLTSWHSKICLQGKHQELVDILQICLISAIKAYYRRNKRYPDRIIVYRDGVGDGQLDTVAKYEVKQLLATFKTIEINYQPTLTVIVVQKRINTRLFEISSTGLKNPPPGTIVDSHITKPALYDFFLVSQNIRQGTVSPTHYIVIYDNKKMKPDHIQRLTYKLCHLYYNWPGTIKVPAPCQYAHKLVSLVGQNIQQEPHLSLADTLYYL
ncbi:piwi-like protein Ago3 [Apis laboriosa]|uniref:piwi-like protein Ago3 n=1 Tax=Apis laboriosa TaxID=183418 RepID=UPI001CC38F0E|nr:piwi-like protein Ago3 [Apis laboriosa]